MPDRLLENEVDLSPEERQESWRRDTLWELSSSDALHWGQGYLETSDTILGTF